MPEGEGRIPEEAAAAEPERMAADRIRSEARVALADARANLGKGERFAERLLESARPFLEAGVLGDDAEARLRAAADLEDDAQALDAVMAALEPLVELKFEDPKRYDGIRGEEVFLPVNEVLTYEVEGDAVRLHVPVNTGRPPLEMMAQIGDGLRKLAAIVREHNASGKGEPIRRIVGTSWIVAKAPALMKRAGFTLKGDISEEVREAHFSSETRPVQEAEMTVEELLRRYG